MGPHQLFLSFKESQSAGGLWIQFNNVITKHHQLHTFAFRVQPRRDTHLRHVKQSRDNTSDVSVLTYETVIYISYETENLYTAELEKKQSVNEGKITYAAYNTPFKIYNKKMYPAFLCLLIPGASPLLLCTKENVLWLY